MSLLSAILLGLIQGVAEFLPISSSGHLAIAEHLLSTGSIDVPDFYDVLLHLGTLIAVFVAYWQDIREMVVEFFSGVRDLAHGTTPNPVPPARRLILLIIVGTLPLFAVLPVKDLVEGLSDNLYFVAGALVFTGLLLFASDRVRKGRKTEKNATLVDVLLVGVGQAIATCPGISRSGTTIMAATDETKKPAQRATLKPKITARITEVRAIGRALSTISWERLVLSLRMKPKKRIPP